jgi:hypothetical protein
VKLEQQLLDQVRPYHAATTGMHLVIAASSLLPSHMLALRAHKALGPMPKLEGAFIHYTTHCSLSWLLVVLALGIQGLAADFGYIYIYIYREREREREREKEIHIYRERERRKERERER